MTSKHLINLVLEFNKTAIFISPDKLNASHLFHRKPLYYRYLQIQSLCKAFELNLQDDRLIVDFTAGNFIDSTQIGIENYIKRVQKFNIEIRKLTIRDSTTEEYDVQRIFSSLFSFRTKLYEISQADSIWLEGKNIAGIYALSIKAPVIDNIKPLASKVDDELSLIIDFQQRDFSKNELIERYNYPDVDLKKIDFDDLFESML